MKVKELIAILNRCDPELHVIAQVTVEAGSIYAPVVAIGPLTGPTGLSKSLAMFWDKLLVITGRE